jgi:formylglycine-generating enzyme required for sulfatase activity
LPEFYNNKNPAGGFMEMTNEKDGSILVKVAEGDFVMGSEDYDDECSVRTIYLKRYFIGKYEVTVGQYENFCRETGRDMPKQPEWNEGKDHPVLNVSWNDAQTYCAWGGLRRQPRPNGRRLPGALTAESIPGKTNGM